MIPLLALLAAESAIRVRSLLAVLVALGTLCIAPIATARSLRITATTTDLSSLAQSIAGELAQVECIVPAGSNPEAFEPHPSDLGKLKGAGIIVRVGLGYDHWLDKLLARHGDAAISRGGRGYVDASIGIPLLEVKGSSLDPTMSDGHAHGLANPHYWLDPKNAEMMSGAIAEAIVRVVPRQAPTELAMLEDVLAFAALPLAAAIVFTGIHTWFGLQVLRRNVVFADLALAQVSALGATAAVVAGHPAASAAGYAYTVLFAAGGALLLTASRAVAASVRQEAFIGVLYVVATAATVLLVDRARRRAPSTSKRCWSARADRSQGDGRTHKSWSNGWERGELSCPIQIRRCACRRPAATAVLRAGGYRSRGACALYRRAMGSGADIADVLGEGRRGTACRALGEGIAGIRFPRLRDRVHGRTASAPTGRSAARAGTGAMARAAVKSATRCGYGRGSHTRDRQPRHPKVCLLRCSGRKMLRRVHLSMDPQRFRPSAAFQRPYNAVRVWYLSPPLGMRMPSGMKQSRPVSWETYRLRMRMASAVAAGLDGGSVISVPPWPSLDGTKDDAM